MGARNDADLLIIGAGPAGSAAGITSARAGRHVVVVDRATFPRDKTCGDGLTTGALRWLEHLGVPLTELEDSVRVSDAALVTPLGRRIGIPLPQEGEHARVMRRRDLDAALVHRGRAEGVEVLEGQPLTGIKPDDDGVEITLEDGRTLRGEVAIAADGQYSATRHLLVGDEPPIRGEWMAFRQYFRRVDDLKIWVLFLKELLPGYAWVFPLPENRANVGFGMLRRPGLTGKLLAKTWRSVLSNHELRDVLGPRAEPEAPHRAWPIPSHLDPERLSIGPVLFSGDAAGVVDPMTGEGIAQALETGALAAEAVLAGGDTQTVEARYRDSVEQALGRDLRLAARLQRILAHPAGAEVALRTVGLSAWTRRNFGRWMFEDYPRAILSTPDRWHRRMLTSPGAYAP